MTRAGSIEHQGYLTEHRCGRDHLDSHSGCMSNYQSKRSEAEINVAVKTKGDRKKTGTFTNQLLKEDTPVKRPKNYNLLTKAPSAFSGVLPVLVREGSLLCSGQLNAKLAATISSIPNSERSVRSNARKLGFPIKEKQFFIRHDRGASHDGNFNSNPCQNRGSLA